MSRTIMFWQVVIVLLIGCPFAISQQLPGLPSSVAFPEYNLSRLSDFSKGCIQALNTTIDCPAFVDEYSEFHPRLGAEEVIELCTAECYESLVAAHSAIKESCKAEEEILVIKRIAYPATYIVDNYIFTYNISCYQVPTTGEYCDILRLAWEDGSSFLEDERCSDCWLGVWSKQLSSPLWYDKRSAEQFSDELLNCNKPEYDYTIPMQYAYNTSTCKTVPPASPTDPVRCPETYTIKAGDDCESVAARNQISSARTA